jgi:CRISPR/Cas system-associated exonuclease Cas4 (RecB family)
MDFVIKKIHETLNNQQDALRNYLGASSIGNHCPRSIYNDYHNPEKKRFTAKQKIIFRLGHRIETLVKDLLREAELLSNDIPKLKSPVQNFGGHIDGIIVIDDIEHVLEIKSCKHSEFLAFCREGLKKWRWSYYCQVQCYMGMSGLKSCVFIAVDKDTAEIQVEAIAFNPELYEQLLFKAEQIINAKIKPPKISNKPTWYQCKMCAYHEFCHYEDT